MVPNLSSQHITYVIRPYTNQKCVRCLMVHRDVRFENVEMEGRSQQTTVPLPLPAPADQQAVTFGKRKSRDNVTFLSFADYLQELLKLITDKYIHKRRDFLPR